MSVKQQSPKMRGTRALTHLTKRKNNKRLLAIKVKLNVCVLVLCKWFHKVCSYYIKKLAKCKVVTVVDD